LGRAQGLDTHRILLAMRRIAILLIPDPRGPPVHCAQEMAHLAGFLPEPVTEFGPQAKGKAV